jgi:C1A family cysteine protease
MRSVFALALLAAFAVAEPIE